MMAVEVNGEKVCLSNVKGKHYAIGNVCTHMAGMVVFLQKKNQRGM
jgi:nitrite reductase/ring-hydroxylating ferredoxin subunit